MTPSRGSLKVLDEGTGSVESCPSSRSVHSAAEHHAEPSLEVAEMQAQVDEARLRRQQLQDELHALKQSELLRRAKAIGVSQKECDAALDSSSPTRRIVALFWTNLLSVAPMSSPLCD